MAIAPSTNLLNALSQLQGSKPTASAARPTATGAAATGAASFSAQLSQVSAASPVSRSGEAGPARVATQTQETPPGAETSQPRPRSRYLGQYVNIVV
ncbi:hypothetical protein [Ferrovibrio sp.]|uniref:hypothetical protein n=1 Tax=Ferrovibrio sp. TaxID=1917215 RepID=UPI003D26773A